MEIALAHLLHRDNQRRHHGRNNHRINIGHAKIVMPENAFQQKSVLITGFLAVSRNTPMVLQLLANICSHDNIAVANIYY